MKVYIAGPLFNKRQREILEKIDLMCRELGFETFLPHRDAGLWYKDSHEEIFKKDSETINECELIVAILLEEDMGTAWEIGYAYSSKIPIIALGESDSLIINRSCKFVKDLEELKNELVKKT